jgi:DNA helicase-2/ATP-dependent DNA helicase PcrA
MADHERKQHYMVFTDTTLQAIAEHDPESPEELARIPGVGRVKLDRYGEAVLALCRGGRPPDPG